MSKKHTITLLNRDGQTFEANPKDDILTAAEQVGIRLPVGCRYGACASCVARLVSGRVDQEKGLILSEADKAKGYVLLCIAHPLEDCSFEVGLDAQRSFFRNPFMRTK